VGRQAIPPLNEEQARRILALERQVDQARRVGVLGNRSIISALRPDPSAGFQKWLYDISPLTGIPGYWQFEWSAAETKWMFTGGSAAALFIGGPNTLGVNTTWTAMGCNLTVPFTGYYEAEGEVLVKNTVAGNVQSEMGLGFNGGAPGVSAAILNPVAGDMSMNRHDSGALTAGQTVGIWGYTNGAGVAGNASQWYYQRLRIHPWYVN
jgi:hypothetical protein